MISPLRTVLKRLSPLLPRKFVKHYIWPRLDGRKQVPYDAKAFFESFHNATIASEFSDRITIFPNANPMFARYHYNAVENSIIEYFRSTQAVKKPSVLDIGSGAGHWIDFYLSILDAQRVVGVELSEPCSDALQAKYRGNKLVRIVQADISVGSLDLGEKFDVINAIGVMFHIVDDRLWRRAVKNLAHHLKDDGLMIIGGQFGMITQNVQFHNVDRFASWEEFRKATSDVALVDKRIRSLRLWKECVAQAGLQIRNVRLTRQHRKIRTPENNLLILGHPVKTYAAGSVVPESAVHLGAVHGAPEEKQ